MHDDGDDARTLDRYDYYRGQSVGRRVDGITRTTHNAVRAFDAPTRLGIRLDCRIELLRSHVCKTQAEVFETSSAWKAEAISKGRS